MDSIAEPGPRGDECVVARHGDATNKGDHRVVNGFLKGRYDGMKLTLEKLAAFLASKRDDATESGVLALLQQAITEGIAKLVDDMVVRVPRHA